MPSRRGGHWVYWPARLFWLPLLGAGMWFLAGMQLDTSQVDADTWRVLFTVTGPGSWFDPVWRGVLGACLLVAGLGATFAYFWEPGPYGIMTAVQYRIFSWAAWFFAILAGLAAISVSGHVVETGAAGLDWRFLATMRSQPLDSLLIGLGALGAVLSYAASWGVRTPSWERASDAAPD